MAKASALAGERTNENVKVLVLCSTRETRHARSSIRSDGLAGYTRGGTAVFRLWRPVHVIASSAFTVGWQ
jgi:hypothetical protein